MQTDTQALSSLSSALALGEAYELTALREEYAKHFRLPDGSSIAVTYADAVHYSSGGKALAMSTITTYMGSAADMAVENVESGLMPEFTYGFGVAVKTFFGWLDDAMVYLWE